MKKNRIKAFLIILALLVLAACGGSNEPEESTGNEENKGGEEATTTEKLVVGVIPSMTEGQLQAPMDKLAAHLEEQVGIPVELSTYPDYQGVVQAMEYGDVNLAFYGPLTYVIANHQSGAEAIITQLIDGEPYYYSYIITHKDSPLETIDDLVANAADLTFAFGDPSSTSGSLIPSIELKEQGVYTNPNEYKFKNVIFSGSHDATALAVENKEVDAGAIDSAIFNVLVEKGTVGDNFKIIWKSDQLFQYPWAVTPDVDEETKQKIKDAFLSIEDQEIFDAFGASGFTEATDADYEPVRKAAIAEGRIK